MKNAVKPLNIFVLSMFIVSAIDSIRNMPATALFGTSLIFFFVFSAIFFLIPAALLSADLTAKLPEKQGIYGWVSSAFGEGWGFLTIWLQWINTMVWYPTILSFIAGTFAYLLDPQLAAHKGYLVAVILSVYWGLTWVNLKGVHVSAKLASYSAVLGTALPMLFIIVLSAYWVLSGHPLQLHFDSNSLLPNLSHGNNWVSLTAIMTSFLGVELCAVHVKQVKSPGKTFPRAMIIAAVFILITMITGSLAIAIVVPAAKINLVSGVMQAFSLFLTAYHIHWLLPVLTLLVVVSAIGGMVNWMIAPAKGLLMAGDAGFLPKVLCKENRHGVPSHLMITQAIFVSAICLVFLLMPSVNGSYWLLTDLSTELYMFMYLLMFIAGFALYKKVLKQASKLILLSCVLGVIGVLITLVVGFFPPAGIQVGSFWHFEFIFSVGIFLMLFPAGLFYWYKTTASTPVSTTV